MSILSVALYKFPINKNITCDDLCVKCAKYKRNIKRIDTRATLSNVLTSGQVLIYSRFEIYTCKNDCRNSNASFISHGQLFRDIHSC